MSVPQMIYYCENKFNVFARQSEYESEPLSLYKESQGVWIDAFYNDIWVTEELISKHIKNALRNPNFSL